MSAIILSALWGVVMMFGGVFFKKRTTPKYWAIAGIVIILFAILMGAILRKFLPKLYSFVTGGRGLQ